MEYSAKEVSLVSLTFTRTQVHHLEQFAESCGVPNLKLCFYELRALITPLMNPGVFKTSDY